MRIIKPSRLKVYGRQYPDALRPLMQWLDQAILADWHSLADVRDLYPHADAVKVRSGNDVTIFNIRGGHYRLIVSIKYRWSMVYILRFLTHREYDSDRWKDEL